MTTEGDLGAAAAALFTLHSSPMVSTPLALQSRLMGLNMPSLSLAGHLIPSTAEKVALVPATPGAGSLMSRPRSQSWAPPSASLLSLLQGDTDASAAGTLCALMKSASPPAAAETENKVISRPRSQSMSAASAIHQNQQARISKGLRPRSTSVSSMFSNQPNLACNTRRSARPRSFSQSSRISARSLSSNRSGGRKRAASLDSAASFFDDYDEFDSEDFEEGDDDVDSGKKSPTLEDIARVGAYSPTSRRERINRFIEKRANRIWRKRIKYDVRKNFADSRLRVKGRFVRKEDEEQLREYLQLL